MVYTFDDTNEPQVGDYMRVAVQCLYYIFGLLAADRAM